MEAAAANKLASKAKGKKAPKRTHKDSDDDSDEGAGSLEILLHCEAWPSTSIP